ncbi:uncharacterized protein I206_100908 [Kwoniella pini CBS 10737]|uniref:Zn(2)-C6 fungal-type domain-containing protein n=1 Tax=Kwoniella pini CBS 10737 TaxID=1296096 RepID=A0A1B9ICD4_9TREE|nr:uncharacterized protein I206_00418 [Kwoniella pini CBS 10737]OCF53117.1 hypothetical protein I206_00418 [Kwoniella pini CBS 10737]
MYLPFGPSASGSSTLDSMSNTPSSSSISQSQSRPRQSYPYSSSTTTQIKEMSYSDSQGWPSSSSPSSSSSAIPSTPSNNGTYITNSQNAWMNWYPALPSSSSSNIPTTIPTTTNTNSTSTYDPNTFISYGFPFKENSTLVGSTNSNKDESTYLDKKDKDFDTAYAAPAINLGTGDRFSQLLEAKMSMMNGMNNSPSMNVNSTSMSNSIPTASTQLYDYRLSEFPVQNYEANPMNPYPVPTFLSTSVPQNSVNPIPIQPITAKSSQHVANPINAPIQTGFITPNRFMEMDMPPPPLPQPVPIASASSLHSTTSPSIPTPYISSPYGDPSRAVDASSTVSAVQSPWMQGVSGYSVSPQPPQGDISSMSPMTSSGTIPNTPYIQLAQPGGSRQSPTYAYQQHPAFDPLAIEKHLSDWSQTQIQPDLVAPLPDPIQYYNRQRSPTSSQGDASIYAPPSNQLHMQSDFLPIAYPHSQPQRTSATPSTHSSSPNPLLTPHPASAPTSVRSSKSPIASFAAPPPPRKQVITGWTENPSNVSNPPSYSQPFSSRMSATTSAEEDLPPVLKIRVKRDNSFDKGSNQSTPQSNPGLVKKITNPLKASSSNLTPTAKGTKFSFSTSINKGDPAFKGKAKKEKATKDEKEKVKVNDETEEHFNGRKKKRKTSHNEEKKPGQDVQPFHDGSSETTQSSAQDQSQKPLIDKTIIACNNCRAKKLKCNGEKPKCFHCDRRGEDSCIYEAILRRRGPGKHNKEKTLKPIKCGKKRKSNQSKQGDEDNSSNDQDTDEDNEEEEEEEEKVKEGKQISKISDFENSQTRSNFSSFGLGGGGNLVGRINPKILNEDEIKGMNYIIKKDQNNGMKSNLNVGVGSGLGLGSKGKGILGMGFGNGLNTQNLGSGSRFELSTARE